MSIEAVARVWSLDLPRRQKVVLLALADHANKHGRNMYPSVDKLVQKTSYSDRLVRLAIKELVNCGHIIVQEIRPGYATVYRLPSSHEVARTPAKVAPLQPFPDPTATIADLPCNSCIPTPAMVANPTYIEEPALEPSYNHGIASKLGDAHTRFEAFAREYPKRLGGLLKEYAKRKHIGLFKDPELAGQIVAGAIRYREYIQKTGKLGTEFVAQMPTWLNQRRWTEPYDISTVVDAKTGPELGVDYILICPDNSPHAIFADPVTKQPFNAAAWFAARSLQPSGKWRTDTSSECEVRSAE